MAGATEKAEWLKSSVDPAYFLDTHTWIFNATERSWLRFSLWAAQLDVCDALLGGRHLVVLKARQLGLTWLCLGYALWLMLFRPAAVILLFSKREDEAQELMTRLQGMYDRLPFYMQCRRVEKATLTEYRLSNGSVAMAFPTTGGRSYTGTFVLADEADFMPDLGMFLNAVKPTVDAGGQLALISTSDKSQPNSTFKRLFRAGWRGTNEYQAIFLPWSARPGRGDGWYKAIRRDMFDQDGSDDNVYQEYPATPEEALSARSLDKRIPPLFLVRVANEATPLPLDFWRKDVPLVDGFLVFRLPTPGRLYVVGVDPAEGNPTSDPSALCVLDAVTCEQVAVCAGRFQPAVMAQKADQIGTFYNRADAMVERNNHGHAVLLWLAENGNLRLLPGLDGRPGWLSNAKGKAVMYDGVVEGCRDGGLVVYDSETIRQLGSLEGSSLRAPTGDHDDRADALALALAGAGAAGMADQVPIVIRGIDPIKAMDRERF
jgi:hypothetical protein